MSPVRTPKFVPQFLLAIVLVGIAVCASTAQTLPFADYRTESWHLPQTPATTAGPVGAMFNPATWSLTDEAGMDFWWDDGNIRSGLDNYGLAFGRGLGFAMNTRTYGTREDSYKIYDYLVGLSGGGRRGTFGMAYRWAHGETQRTPRHKALSLGFIGRGTRYASFGASGVLSLESSDAQYVFDLGVRPFGRHWLTLFADYTVNGGQSFFQEGVWGCGLEVRPVQGVHLGLRAREQLAGDDWDYALTLGLTLNNFNATALPRYNADGDLMRTSYLLRATPPHSGLDLKGPRFLASGPRYYALNLENRVLTYQKYRYFDDTHVAWLDLLGLLERLKKENRIDIVAVNLAGFRGRPSLIWEFRQQLQQLQAAGKEIIIHGDRLGQSTYYLASVADRLTLDPQGNVALPGITLSRSYLKGTLEKLGVGFQEHRYFKYKSAAETLSRDSMSEADREQRQRIVDVIYENFRQGVAEGRDLKATDYDQLVDELGQLTPAEARDQGLVDAVGRWDAVPRWLKENRRAQPAPADWVQPERRPYDDVWGPGPVIPVVYAVGSCDMDSGINGRGTSAFLRSLVRDSQVVAVVLRADSPGGDPLPSDLVADAVRQLRKAGKPVIVSQGDVAASGGYWISMDGSTILTTPLTITGSIGVISGWVWDDGLAEKMGITSDAVSRGRHADLYTSVNFPFLGSLPRRPMSQDELDRAEKLIRGMYDDFLAAVASGRKLDKEAVHAIAQGRVWMGGDAIERGLCDSFGGLGDALKTAKNQAGVPDWRRVQVVEYPPRKLFQMPSLFPGLPGLGWLGLNLEAHLHQWLASAPTEADFPPVPHALPGLDGWETQYIQRLGQEAGQPLLVLPPETLPLDWRGEQPEEN